MLHMYISNSPSWLKMLKLFLCLFICQSTYLVSTSATTSQTIKKPLSWKNIIVHEPVGLVGTILGE